MSDAPTAIRLSPHDFAETFIRVGWEGVEAECRAHKAAVKRWLVESSEADLQRRRREYLEAKYSARCHRIGGIRPGSRKLRTVSATA